MLAGISQYDADEIAKRCPDLDFVSIQAYGALASIPEIVRESGYNGAYLITEWGPTGHWEMPLTPWQAPIEETSTEKAKVYFERYRDGIARDSVQCMGSYAFFWGQKKERTPTWYGLFTEDGELTSVADELAKHWTGKYPVNQAPSLDSMRLDGKDRFDGIYLNANATYNAVIYASDPDKDVLSYKYELLAESTDLQDGGDFETRPKSIDGLINEVGDGKILLNTNGLNGAYRLFFYAYDGNIHAATGNIPFYVK